MLPELLEWNAPILSASKIYYRVRNLDHSVRVVTEDWDTLVILDACRFDTFEAVCDLDGTLEHRRSLGSATDEFIQRNFGANRYEDIVYVSANPRVEIAFQGSFHDVIQVWRDRWDETIGSVRPETVVEAAREAHEQYPHKRIIVHFIQPHAPFIGDFGRKHLPSHSTLEDHRSDNVDSQTCNIWEHLRAGDVELNAVQAAYRENLNMTLSVLRPFLACIEGRIVVTSDHGNLFGERLPPFMKKMYGHPMGLHAPPLVDVPWFIQKGSNRRKIVAEPPQSRTRSDVAITEETERRLAELGYR
jgi:hypothetical protein